MNGWRFLVDEDTDPEAASALRTRGYDAVAVQDSIGKGTLDPDIRAYAEETNRVLVTTDRGFQRPERHRRITVLMVPGDLSGDEIARRVVEVIEYADTPAAISSVIWLSER